MYWQQEQFLDGCRVGREKSAEVNTSLIAPFDFLLEYITVILVIFQNDILYYDVSTDICKYKGNRDTTRFFNDEHRT